MTDSTADQIRRLHGVGVDNEPVEFAKGGIIPLKDVARLDLKPGDTLVVTLAGNPSAKDAHEAKLRILAILGDQIDEHHLLVVPETAKLSVMRQAGVAS